MRVHVGASEWWPVVDLDMDLSDWEGEDLVDLPDDLYARFEAAREEFHAAHKAVLEYAARLLSPEKQTTFRYGWSMLDEPLPSTQERDESSGS